MTNKQMLANFLDSQDFYELMQAYRHTPLDAAKEYEAVRFALNAAIHTQPTSAVVQATYTLEEDFQHFLVYSGALDTDARLRMAYEHGNDRGMQGEPLDPQQCVYLVHTGLAHEGQETYTRHNVCPPMCDFESLYTNPPSAVVQEPVAWKNIDEALADPVFQRVRAVMGTENWFQDNALFNTLKVFRELLAATPPPTAKVEPTTQPCQNTNMGTHACTNRGQCWEPCGELGHSAEHARVSAVSHATPPRVAGDAEDARRYEFVLDCDVIAARQYMPKLDVQAYKNKIRARHDAAIAAGGNPTTSKQEGVK